MAASPPLSKSDAHDRPRLSDKNGGRTDAKSPGLCSYYEHDRMKVDIFIDESLKRACLSSSNKSGTSSKEGPGDARHHESNAADLYNVDGMSNMSSSIMQHLHLTASLTVKKLVTVVIIEW